MLLLLAHSLSLLLMIVRLMTHGDPLFLELSAVLSVDLEALVRRVGNRVVPEDPSHVVEHPQDGESDRRAVGIHRVIQQEPCIDIPLVRAAVQVLQP